jgi:hypothetical protein
MFFKVALSTKFIFLSSDNLDKASNRSFKESAPIFSEAISLYIRPNIDSDVIGVFALVFNASNRVSSVFNVESKPVALPLAKAAAISVLTVFNFALNAVISASRLIV